MLIDSHTHYDLILKKGQLSEEELLDDCSAAGIEKSVQIAIDIESCRWSRDFARRHGDKNVLFSLGIHPSSEAAAHDLHTLDELVRDIINSSEIKSLFGIGECGLDFYRMRQQKEAQIISFETQVDLAIDHNLPLIVHSRDAMNETISILKSRKPGKGIMHCFSGDTKSARKVLDLGFYISFAGNITYKNAHELRESASFAPLDRLLLETDAPFLSPVPVRGKINRPAFILHTYAFLAELKKVSLDTVEEQIRENFNALSR